MDFPRKRWRLALMGVLTVLAVSVTSASPAFAAEPNEWGSWTAEKINAGLFSQALATNGTLAEARNGNNLLQAWRGATNNIVWMSFNNGKAFQVYNPDGTSSATYYSPTVVPYGPSSFEIYHTGTDNNIYYTVVYADGSDAGRWFQAAPGQQSNGPVSVTQLGGPGSYNELMVYRGVSSDQIWGTYNSNSGVWSNAVNIGGGSSPSAPSVTSTPYGETIVVARGEDNEVWMIVGTTDGGFGSWVPQAGTTYMQPTVVYNGAVDRVLVSEVGTDNRPYWRQYDAYEHAQEGWSQDTTGWQTNYPVFLSANGPSIYALITGQVDGYAYYKQAFSG